METEKELIKSREELFKKPNPFEWSKYKKHLHKGMQKHIMKDPYGCDGCGDTYNRNDLIKLQTDRVCRNCLCFVS